MAQIEAGAVAVTVTDPAFDARAHRAATEQGDWRRGKRRVNSALPFDPLDAAGVRVAGAHIARITRRWIVVCCAERQFEAWATALEAAGARFVRLGLALRTNPRPQLTGDRPAPAADLLVIAHGAERMRWHGRGRPARWPSPAARFDAGGQVHPTQKPLTLVRALVEDFTDDGDLVCDPFAGSGTTAVACRELGRKFIGWEIDAGYHGGALRRIEAAREQLRLAVSTHCQERLL